MILLLFAALAFTTPAQAESTLQFNYQVDCDAQDTKSFPGIIAEIRLGKRLLRAYLVRYQQQQVVTLGSPTPTQLSSMVIRYLRHPSCNLQVIDTQIRELDTHSLALLHSPYLILRAEQASHPDRDIPLHLGYSKIPTQTGFAIKYTMYFSNESSHGLFATTKSKSQAIYGRRTDIEWIYQVNFDPTGKVVKRQYQSGVILGIGHATKPFKGKFLTGTQHPILYNIAKHNVFGDRPYPGQGLRAAGAHLTPFEEIAEPEAREDWMWRNPWSFDVSDRELRRTRSLTYPSNDYLYVRIGGSLHGAKLAITGNGMKMKKITRSKLGEDLWGKTSYVAFRLQQFPTGLSSVGHSIDFVPSHSQAKIETLQFFRLVHDPNTGFKGEEITSHFVCDEGHCSY